MTTTLTKPVSKFFPRFNYSKMQMGFVEKTSPNRKKIINFPLDPKVFLPVKGLTTHHSMRAIAAYYGMHVEFRVCALNPMWFRT